MTAPLVHVVDDDPVVRETLVWMLEAIGYRAQEHAGPATVPTGDGTGCVILDEILEDDARGLDAVDPATGLLAGRPVVLFTGFASEPSVRARAESRGVRHVLGKPAQLSVLVEVVQAALKEAS
jgi:FixJ family two-component response regulator